MVRRQGLAGLTPLEEIIESVGRVAENDLLRCPLAYVEDGDERSWQLKVFFTGLLTSVQHTI